MHTLRNIIDDHPTVEFFPWAPAGTSGSIMSDILREEPPQDRVPSLPSRPSGQGFLIVRVTMTPALEAPGAAASPSSHWDQDEHTGFGGVEFPSDGGVKNQGVDQDELD